MRSMTGYGRHRAQCDGRSMTIELKSVNHRSLDIGMRLPRALLFLDDPIRKGLAARLSRGHVDVFLTYENMRNDARTVRVDQTLAALYADALGEIVKATGLADDRSAARIAGMPDVLTVSEQDEDIASVTRLAEDALTGALDALLAMREREGDSLHDDLLCKLATLKALHRAILTRAPQSIVDMKDRLSARVAELLSAPLEPDRLAQEVALLAGKAAIDEELVRLESHFAQFASALESAEPIGRRLDFLVQEMGREVNTIGSKASDLLIANAVIDAKAELEKLKEQLANVE